MVMEGEVGVRRGRHRIKEKRTASEKLLTAVGAACLESSALSSFGVGTFSFIPSIFLISRDKKRPFHVVYFRGGITHDPGMEVRWWGRCAVFGTQHEIIGLACDF